MIMRCNIRHLVWLIAIFVFVLASPGMAQVDPNWSDESVAPVSFAAPLQPISENQRDGTRETGSLQHGPDFAAKSRMHGKSPPTAVRFGIHRIVSVIGSLAVVIGLFALTVLGLRLTRPSGHESLPEGVVKVLGQTTLLGRRELHLVQVGQKLLLLTTSPTQVQTLTEITDPTEVQRMTELCGQSVRDGRPANSNDELVRPGWSAATEMSA
jgi:flagellar biogenesis protein FliO